MKVTLSAVAAALAVCVTAQTDPAAINAYTATGTAAVAAAAATAKTESPVSHVKGKVFDRIVFIWLENTDATAAAADPNLQYLAKQGITLTNLYAVTHPSEPNYIATMAGEYFGMDNDAFNQVPANVSTVIDLLEEKGISWGEYMECSPFSGFEGYAYINQTVGVADPNCYVRKHNPAIIYNSVADNYDRLAKIKNFTLFESDLAANTLPQWMFITPNELNDGHDTNVTFAGTWTRNFLEPLLTNKNFMDNTLVLVAFDEDETYSDPNKVFGFLIGDVIPKHLIGSTDRNYYNHYSQISTVEANWNLHTLGRWDAGANVYDFVADVTGDRVRDLENPNPDNSSYPGLFNSKNKNVPIPVPNTSLKVHGRTVLPSIVDLYKRYQNLTYYTDSVKIPDGLHPPVYP